MSLDHTKSQWVDLGDGGEACIIQPDTCGAAGGAVAFWARVTYMDSHTRGIISSKSNDSVTGIMVETTNVQIDIRFVYL